MGFCRVYPWILIRQSASKLQADGIILKRVSLIKSLKKSLLLLTGQWQGGRKMSERFNGKRRARTVFHQYLFRSLFSSDSVCCLTAPTRFVEEGKSQLLG